jgi:hypothetical protein
MPPLSLENQTRDPQMKLVYLFFIVNIALFSLIGCASTCVTTHEGNGPFYDCGCGEKFAPPTIQILPEPYPFEEPTLRFDLHPQDLPIGIWDIWSITDWEFAVAQTRLGELNFLDREFARLSGLNATFIINGITNEPLHVEAHKRGLLQPAVTLSFTAEYADSAEARLSDTRVPGGYPRWKSYIHVIQRFVVNTDLGDPEVRQTAFDVLDEIVDSQYAAYGEETRSTPFYLLMKEGWERDIDIIDVREYSLLFEHTVDKIREKDNSRSIVYFGSYSVIANREAFGTSKVSKAGMIDSVFTGKMMRGWNVFNNEWYPFYTKRGSRDWVLKNYAGNYYYRQLYNGYCYWLRELTRDVERYAETVNPAGPQAEWWQDIQVQREERVSADGSFRMVYRRPTNLEYSVQAYLALASGARGITLWPYKGSQFMGEYEDLTGSMTLAERPIRTSSKGSVAKEKQNYGAIVTASPSSYTDSLSIADFRKPFSESENNPDAFAVGLNVEPYPGNHYPYDRIADLYANLHTLLPELRVLRWWWALDGVDKSFVDVGGDQKEQYFDHRSIYDTMQDSSLVHDALSLGQRFRLRAINGDDEGPIHSSDEQVSSNIYVGLFDDPANPDVETYLLVNMSSNSIYDDVVVDATEETVAKLIFDGDTALGPVILWQDRTRDTRTLPEEMLMAGEGRVLEVPLLPGDTKLISVSSK